MMEHKIYSLNLQIRLQGYYIRIEEQVLPWTQGRTSWYPSSSGIYHLCKGLVEIPCTEDNAGKKMELKALRTERWYEQSTSTYGVLSLVEWQHSGVWCLGHRLCGALGQQIYLLCFPSACWALPGEGEITSTSQKKKGKRTKFILLNVSERCVIFLNPGSWEKTPLSLDEAMNAGLGWIKCPVFYGLP